MSSAAASQPAPVSASAAPVLTVVVPCYNERANIAPMVRALEAALGDLAWEVIFVDDDSPDGTAEAARALAGTDPRVRCLRRIGRRGLASAVIEGALSSSAEYVAVMDGDLQHDETRLPEMLAALQNGAELAVGSRHVGDGHAGGLASPFRHRLSRGGIKLAQAVLPVRLSDPMSGFFMLPRALFEQLAPRLTGRGFKILLDLVLAAPTPLRVQELPFRFRARQAGESKLDVLVLAQFVGVLLDRLLGGRLPLRFLAFAGVGAVGVLVHLLILLGGRRVGIGFPAAQAIATVASIAFNFWLNNWLTYRDQRLRGTEMWRGLTIFLAVCAIGAVANIGIASALYRGHAGWTPAGAAGAAVGVVWNYAVSSTLVWRVR